MHRSPQGDDDDPQGTEDASPMAPAGPSDSQRVAQPHRAASTSAAAIAILVVDDDPAILALTSRLLGRAGATVTALDSGRAAIRAIVDGAVRPALLLTDIEMPAMSGIELAARVGALRPGVRIVMMTGDQASARAARDHPDLVASVLLKPFTKDELLAAVGLETSDAESRGAEGPA
jgi:CheY-like chemotaxis protein